MFKMKWHLIKLRKVPIRRIYNKYLKCSMKTKLSE